MAQDISNNCGYWLYLGENDVPKAEGTIKPVITSESTYPNGEQVTDEEWHDCSGMPVLSGSTKPLAEYTSSQSVPTILTRAEKGQALTHLEMDFNLASLLHKVNTSSVGSSFDTQEDCAVDGPEDPEVIPYERITCSVGIQNGNLDTGSIPKASDPRYNNFYGEGEPVIYGPYFIPRSYNLPGQYYSRVRGEGQEISQSTEYAWTYELSHNPELTASLYTDDISGSVQYDVYRPLHRESNGLYPIREGRAYFTRRVETVQVDETTSVERIHFDPFESPGPEEYGPNTGSEEGKGYGTDIYFERHKPTRNEEHAGMFATFSYAPVKNGDQTIIQNGFQTIKVQHTSDEIRYKLANERIPGTLDVAEDFHVTGSSFIHEDEVVEGSLKVSESVFVKKDAKFSSSVFVRNDLRVSGNVSASNDIECRTLQVHQSASVDNGLTVTGHSVFKTGSNLSGSRYALEVFGNVYVHGRIENSIYTYGENNINPNYAQTYQRFGTQDTDYPESGSQSDRRLKDNRKVIEDPLNKIMGVSGYEFDWAPAAEKQGHDVGLVAQELREILPEAVGEGKDGYLRIDYAKVVPLLVEAVKQLTWEVWRLKGIVR